jgi:hypothetical protein
VELEQLDVHEARETLGVFIAMNSNQESQTQELWEKAMAWAEKFDPDDSHMPKHGSRYNFAS